MSERKVLNKYYPPDFDPTKIPKLRLPKNRTFNIRLMAPFNMRCNTCGEYIYKGKKFNSRKETVENETYLGLHIYRFYIKCPKCIAEISFKTDPKNTDYELEAGATRNFEALRTAEKLALKEQQEKDDEEANNPMKLLENRTKASQREMDTLEMLEDLKEVRRKQERVNTEELLASYRTKHQKTEDELLEEESKALQEEFRCRNLGEMKRILDVSKEDEPSSKVQKSVDLSSSTHPKFKRPLSGYSKQFDKIRASIKPKSKIQDTSSSETNQPVGCHSDEEKRKDVIVEKGHVTANKGANVEAGATKSVTSALKLIEYSDSDEE